MCRIFFNACDAVSYKHSDLVDFFSILEKRQGGDGNGVYLLDGEKTVKTMGDASSLLPYTIDKRFLFHTRLGTAGKKKIYNVQPLVNGRYIIAHNGIFSQHAAFQPYLGLRSIHSDSHTILNLICAKGILNFYIGFLNKYYGVVVVYDKETDLTYLLKTSGTFQAGIFDKEDGKEYIYGSSHVGYWKISYKEDLDDGMYLLKADGYIQLHKPIPIKYTNYSRGENWKTWQEKEAERKKAAIEAKKKKKEAKKKNKLIIEKFPCGILDNCKYQCKERWDKSCNLYDAYEVFLAETKGLIVKDYPCYKHSRCDSICSECLLYDRYMEQRIENEHENWNKKNISYYPDHPEHDETFEYEAPYDLLEKCDECNRHVSRNDCQKCKAYKDHLVDEFDHIEITDEPCGSHEMCQQQCQFIARDCELLTKYYNHEYAQKKFKKAKDLNRNFTYRHNKGYAHLKRFKLDTEVMSRADYILLCKERGRVQAQNIVKTLQAEQKEKELEENIDYHSKEEFWDTIPTEKTGLYAKYFFHCTKKCHKNNKCTECTYQIKIQEIYNQPEEEENPNALLVDGKSMTRSKYRALLKQRGYDSLFS